MDVLLTLFVFGFIAIVLLISAVVATCLGVGVARRAMFPLLFLTAAVPFGDQLTP